jgi:hypothetical protein
MLAHASNALSGADAAVLIVFFVCAFVFLGFLVWMSGR